MSLSKNELRRMIKQHLRLMGEDEKRTLSQDILRQIESRVDFQRARNVLLYWSLPDEVQTHEFVRKWANEKHILLPVVVGDELEIRPYTCDEEMRKGSFDIQEPVGDRWEHLSRIDFALIPGVGFDSSRHRLGRGKGYYDRLLPHLSCPKIGVCYPCQIQEAIPCDPWDIPMDDVCTLPPFSPLDDCNHSGVSTI